MDGFLDDARNYTAFVEIIMEGGVIGRSPYLEPRRPGGLVRDISKSSPNTVMMVIMMMIMIIMMRIMMMIMMIIMMMILMMIMMIMMVMITPRSW